MTSALAPIEPLHLFALTPAAVAGAQAELRAWARAKVAEAEREVEEVTQNLHIATEARMQSDAWRRQLAQVRRRLVFLDKLSQALDAGYLIVPNLPMDVFAVRTTAFAPVGRETSRYGVDAGSWRFRQAAEMLPAGEGRYVSPRPKIGRRSFRAEDTPGSGKLVDKIEGYATEFRDVVFPVALVKPEVLDATRRALALRVFDELGMVQVDTGTGSSTRRGDPIVVGRILPWKDRRNLARAVTCFVGWWLDTRSLA